MPPVYSLLLALAQSLSPTPAAEPIRTPDSVDRTMWLHALAPGVVERRCIGKFRRLKIPMISLDIDLELDASGGVTAARMVSNSPDPKLEQCLLESIRKQRFADKAPRHGIYVSTMGNASLLPKPAKHVQYAPADAAVIYRWKAAIGGLCRVAGKPAPGEVRKNACTAFVSMIDGRVASWVADNNRVSPGTHTLWLSCALEEYPGLGLSGLPLTSWVTQVHAFTLEAGTNYRVEPRWEGDQCIVDLIDVRKGQAMEKLPPLLASPAP